MEAPSIAGSAATTAGAAGAAGSAGATGAGTGAPPPMSIVDAASAALSGRSAAAAKATDEKKAHARVAAHAAGQRVPIKENTKLVRSAYTSGATTRSFTSTVYEPVTTTEYEMVRVEKKPKKKGYCRVHTSAGDLNVELHCDIVPRTCENFLTLAERGYYNGTIFHRCIRNFMIQGGDPTGTGKGGQSAWGKAFQDEFDSRLGHSERGVLSMANSGPHSNGSQFFVLFKSAPHLNYKHSVFGRVVGGLDTLAAMERSAVDDKDRPLHSVFGRVVGGMETLTAMERSAVDDKDRPLRTLPHRAPPQLQAICSGPCSLCKPITIESITVFVNPYTEKPITIESITVFVMGRHDESTSLCSVPMPPHVLLQKPVTIESITVFVNPYTEVDAEAEAEEAAAREKEKERKGKELTWEEQQELVRCRVCFCYVCV
ncbi:unnamed protein product [Closterium sp. NIES-65]|nr:unnamed protein product [Closterium sp. NIES-65]